MRENERKGEKKREKMSSPDSRVNLIQFTKRKTKYTCRNARNFKKWPQTLDV